MGGEANIVEPFKQLILQYHAGAYNKSKTAKISDLPWSNAFYLQFLKVARTDPEVGNFLIADEPNESLRVWLEGRSIVEN